MAPGKEDASILDQKRQDGSYPNAQPSSTAPLVSESATEPAPIAGPSTQLDPLEKAPTYEEATSATGHVPTVDSPFDFPTDAELPPSYDAHSEAEAGPSSSASTAKPIAIPQIAPDPAAPFLPSYPPSLLASGITEQTWRSFLNTVSAFLTAKVSDRAIAHAGDMAKSLGEPPKNYGKSLVTHTKSVGKQIAKDAKRFNVFGVAFGVIGGAISIPMHVAFGAVHTIFEIPATAISAVSKSPRTPVQRAATYAAVANKDWFNARGLHAVLLDTKELAEMIHVPMKKILEMAADGGKNGTAAATMAALEPHIEKLKVVDDEVVVLNGKSLWLVLVPVVKEEEPKK
ncbi:subunit of the RNA polymerase II mediator complex [Pochonia chlamydosporia 170]|uniref:Subunit of the RNA polymerase II mediator complex n=1 Tax=Pochonia chlamydosporia 170 TaxID=1380566 RepID=A0A179F539_METCM|nr:subunit of the RNA polymerase II mediator complex [Pochonia chlamydosporia 170]OAQ60535.1 subunit of the RNA polymerase II mediator complex [Pochonia chlamydosporia 170]